MRLLIPNFKSCYQVFSSSLTSYVKASSCLHTKRMFSTNKVKVNDVDLSYVKVGQGNHTLLLLPGALGCTQTDFLPQVEEFDRDKFTIISLDFRGYGNSRPPKRDFPLNFYHRDADDAINLMKVLGFEKYSVLGWSDGGNSACIMAANHPEFINKLVIWGSNSYITPDEYVGYQSIRDINLWSPRMRDPMVKMYGLKEFEEMWHSWVDIFGEMEKHEDGNIDLYRKDLRKIQSETLIIHGVKDKLVPMFQIEHLKNGIKNSKLLVWEDGSHNLHLRFHQRFKRAVEDFLLTDENIASNL